MMDFLKYDEGLIEFHAPRCVWSNTRVPILSSKITLKWNTVETTLPGCNLVTFDHF